MLDDLSKFVVSRKPPPAHEPAPPSRAAYEGALAEIEGFRKDRDRWIDVAAASSREVRDLRASLGAARASLEEAARNRAHLEARIDGLARENAELRDEVDRLSGRASPARPPVEGSWSGLVEGG